MKIESFEEYKHYVGAKEGTQLANNKGYLNIFVKWTGLNPKQLIDEAEDDRKNPTRGISKPQKRLEGFFTYLTTEYKTTRGKHTGKHQSGTTARQTVSCLKKFYERNGFPVGKLEVGKVGGKKENKRLEHSPADVRKMIETANSKRDQSLIAFGYQGGFDAKTVSLLDLSDFSDKDINKLLKNEVPETPILLNLVRDKEKVDFWTCLGYDSLNLFRAYLNERQQRGEEMNLDSPAFVLDRGEGRMKEHLIHYMMKTVVVKAGIVSVERLEKADFNIAGYHSLRGTFSKRLEYAGMSPAYIDYMQGHKLPHNGAYRTPNPKKLLDKYREYEHVLSISEGPRTLTEINEDLEKKLKERDYKIQGMETRLNEMEKVNALILKKLG
jgi:integrase